MAISQDLDSLVMAGVLEQDTTSVTDTDLYNLGYRNYGYRISKRFCARWHAKKVIKSGRV
jgi:hypothetical protein